jgi:hypothetical protein
VKPSVSPTTTSRVLLDIERAVAPVERARTAAAVERVLRTASPGISPDAIDVVPITKQICRDVGVKPVQRTLCQQVGCECLWEPSMERVHATPGMVVDLGFFDLSDQVQTYAPWRVSPHLIEGVD